MFSRIYLYVCRPNYFYNYERKDSNEHSASRKGWRRDDSHPVEKGKTDFNCIDSCVDNHISCSNDSPDDSLVPLPMIGETFSCWPKGTYSGEVIESEFAPSSQSVIKILTAPIAAPDSLWPCVGHQVVVIRNQHEFHIGDTIVFEMTGRCERYLDLLNIWWVAIEIKE